MNRGFCFHSKFEGVTDGTPFATLLGVIETKEHAMRHHYSTKRLSRREWLEIEEILLDEMDIQCWYGVTYCSLLGEEIYLAIQ